MQKIQKLWHWGMCLLLLAVVALTALPQQAHADFPEKPVAFVVIDHDGDVDSAVYKEWRQVVRWAYHFPYYKILDDSNAGAEVLNAVQKDVQLDKAALAAIAEQSQVEVLVVARIYAMDEEMVTSFRLDHETYMRVEASADLLVYKKDGDKFLKKRLRERELRDLGNYDKPEYTIKWELSKLVNTMENRPIIGS